MFDSLPDAEDERAADDREAPSGGAGRWAHFPAIAVFCFLFFPFKSFVWSWYVAIGAAFSVYVFWFSLGSGLKDLDDLFGSSEVLRFLPKMLMLHALPLCLLLSGLFLWLQLRRVLPEWATQEGSRGSLWFLLGCLVMACVSVGEGVWMAGKVKGRFEPKED